MKLLAISLIFSTVFFGFSFGVQSQAGVFFEVSGSGARLIRTGETTRPVTSESLTAMADEMATAPMEVFYENLKALSNPVALDLLGMNRQLSDLVMTGILRRLKGSDIATLKTLAHLFYFKAAIEKFESNVHRSLYFENYRRLKDLPAACLKELGRNFSVPADETLLVLTSPEILQHLAGEAFELSPEQLKIPATEATFRDVFEFAALKDLFNSHRAYDSFIGLYVSDGGTRQIFKSGARSDLSTAQAFEKVNHARLLTMVGDFHLNFATALMKRSSGRSAFEYAEEALRMHQERGLFISTESFEKFLIQVRDLTNRTQEINRIPATTQAQVIENVRLLSSLRAMAASQLRQFKSRKPDDYWRRLYRDAFDMGIVDYTLMGYSSVPKRAYQLEPVYRRNDAERRACETLFI